jgi:hypothetical protein
VTPILKFGPPSPLSGEGGRGDKKEFSLDHVGFPSGFQRPALEGSVEGVRREGDGKKRRIRRIKRENKKKG